MNALRRAMPDLVVLAGLCLIAAGVGWFALGLAPIVLGVGLIVAVRYGSR
jgi:hypothetical protein